MKQQCPTEGIQNSTSERVYSGVYHSLVIGMTVATILFSIGVVLALVRPAAHPLTVDVTHVARVRGTFGGLLHLDPIAFMVLGTIATILTPIARVGVSLFAFLADRDYTFVWITALVLLAAAASVGLALFGFAS